MRINQDFLPIVNNKSTSSTSVYSANYINNNVGIIATGSNPNAIYIKFSDGTLIQYGTTNLTADTLRSAGGLTYYSGNDDIVLPEFFINSDYTIFTGVQMANMNFFAQSYGAPYATDKFVLNFVSTGQNESRYIYYLCIGRWK